MSGRIDSGGAGGSESGDQDSGETTQQSVDTGLDPGDGGAPVTGIDEPEPTVPGVDVGIAPGDGSGPVREPEPSETVPAARQTAEERQRRRQMASELGVRPVDVQLQETGNERQLRLTQAGQQQAAQQQFFESLREDQRPVGAGIDPGEATGATQRRLRDIDEDEFIFDVDDGEFAVELTEDAQLDIAAEQLDEQTTTDVRESDVVIEDGRARLTRDALETELATQLAAEDDRIGEDDIEFVERDGELVARAEIETERRLRDLVDVDIETEWGALLDPDNDESPVAVDVATDIDLPALEDLDRPTTPPTATDDLERRIFEAVTGGVTEDIRSEEESILGERATREQEFNDRVLADIERRLESDFDPSDGDIDTDRLALAAGAAVAVPEPATTAGGAAVLGGLTAAAILADARGRGELEIPSDRVEELEIGEGQVGAELEIAQQLTQGEIDASRRFVESEVEAGDRFAEELEIVEQEEAARREIDESIVPDEYPIPDRDFPRDAEQDAPRDVRPEDIAIAQQLLRQRQEEREEESEDTRPWEIGPAPAVEMDEELLEALRRFEEAEMERRRRAEEEEEMDEEIEAEMRRLQKELDERWLRDVGQPFATGESVVIGRQVAQTEVTAPELAEAEATQTQIDTQTAVAPQVTAPPLPMGAQTDAAATDVLERELQAQTQLQDGLEAQVQAQQQAFDQQLRAAVDTPTAAVESSAFVHDFATPQATAFATAAGVAAAETTTFAPPTGGDVFDDIEADIEAADELFESGIKAADEVMEGIDELIRDLERS